MLAGIEQRRKQFYETLVRRRGLFRKIGGYPTAREAFLKGKVAVETSAAASFKVEGEKPGGLSKAGWGVLPKRKFRMSKKEPEVYVQKRRFRISTGGEKREITFRGLEAIRLKAGKKKKEKEVLDIFRARKRERKTFSIFRR